MEQLAAGGVQPPSRLRDVETEELIEELQEKVRGLQADKEGLKQRLLVAKQQLLTSQSRRPAPYERVLPRVNSGLKKLRDDMSSPSPTRPRGGSTEPQSPRLDSVFRTGPGWTQDFVSCRSEELR